jgi:hypothetical protein
VAPPTHPRRRSTDHLDLELDLRDAADAMGVVDLNARMRPAGGRRSSRHTHTRLVAALARIQANSLAANGLGARPLPVDAPLATDLLPTGGLPTGALGADPLVVGDRDPLGCGIER